MKRIALIIATATATAFIVGAVLYLLTPRTLATDACINNLLTIQGAKQMWAAERQRLPNDVPTDSDLFGQDKYIRTRPSCPLGGTYTLGAASEPVRCTVPRHKLPPEMLKVIPHGAATPNRRPAGQTDGSDNVSASVAADRACLHPPQYTSTEDGRRRSLSSFEIETAICYEQDA